MISINLLRFFISNDVPTVFVITQSKFIFYFWLFCCGNFFRSWCFGCRCYWDLCIFIWFIITTNITVAWTKTWIGITTVWTKATTILSSIARILSTATNILTESTIILSTTAGIKSSIFIAYMNVSAIISSTISTIIIGNIPI